MHTPRIQADNEKCMSLTAIESNTAELKSITARFKELDELEVAIRKERAALQERERAIKVEFSMGQYNIRKHPHFTAELLRGVLVGTGLEHVMPILETVGRYAQHLSGMRWVHRFVDSIILRFSSEPIFHVVAHSLGRSLSFVIRSECVGRCYEFAGGGLGKCGVGCCMECTD